MNQLPKILASKTKIRFQDCDPFNHLNNGNYTNYFMNHREDALIENYNLDIYKIAKKEGKSWVSSSNQIAYLKPALLMETVIIESQLIHYNTSEIHAEMRMYNEDKSHLKSVIWCGFVHYNLLEQKRETHTEDLMTLFKSINSPIDRNIFEERINQLKSNPLIKHN
ncbi:acyl-CoA thioesterase [Thalassobellus suaedae]|uniref:Acyl-CoA thioesterase n=1 Tax=Thalassobellus suaedae TaxID=3074124 RepID=A0ABY9Y3R9_9FLAO|nr:acyl-CoA thioesterase [Flavobacteriaceae bacterium HL-DH14]WNH12727.1 acyl-CoA thioesterase [Flavobacteriaceae bacterium HL-DH10]